MRVVIATLGLYWLISGLPAAGTEDRMATNPSSHCVKYEINDSRISDFRGRRSWHRLSTLTNNCGYTVRIRIRDNAFGSSLCGDFPYVLTLRPGGSSKQRLHSIKGEIRMVWCAEARDKGHPDYGACPTKIQSPGAGRC